MIFSQRQATLSSLDGGERSWRRASQPVFRRLQLVRTTWQQIDVLIRPNSDILIDKTVAVVSLGLKFITKWNDQIHSMSSQHSNIFGASPPNTSWGYDPDLLSYVAIHAASTGRTWLNRPAETLSASACETPFCEGHTWFTILQTMRSVLHMGMHSIA